MGDYTTAHCFLLLGNPTTNIKYINGATMPEDFAKYEALANFFLSGADCDPKCKVMDAKSGCNCARTCNALAELVAMVREARTEIKSLRNPFAHWLEAQEDFARIRAAKGEKEDD